MTEGLGNIEFRRRTLPGKVSIRDVQELTCARFGVTLTALQAQTRVHSLAHPRQIAMHLARHFTGKSLPEIGRAFGGRDHTTVLFADRKYSAWNKNDQVGTALKELRHELELRTGQRIPASRAQEVAEANALLTCAA